MRSYKTEGIIVKRKDFREADRILTIFTRTHGKIIVRASGIRRIPSRRSPHVELLNYCSISLYQGRAFPILVEAQTIESFAEIKQDLQKIGYAFHLCELIDGLCPENQENQLVFDLLQRTLKKISFVTVENHLSKDQDIMLIVKQFQIELLSLLGYWDANDITNTIDIDQFVENLIEKKLRSRQIFSHL
jgi:DNA repair protein RecO (recombination protein O)